MKIFGPNGEIHYGVDIGTAELPNGRTIMRPGLPGERIDSDFGVPYFVGFPTREEADVYRAECLAAAEKMARATPH